MQSDKKKRSFNILSYASLAISSAILINFFNTRIYNFYTDEVKLNIFYIPIVMTIYAIWNAVNDPLFGWLSDKTRTRFGRRFPYILFGFIPLTIAFTAIWLIPISLVESQNQIKIFLYMITTLLIFDTLYTIVILNWQTLYAEKFKTTKERNLVAALRQLIAVVGVIISVVVSPLIFQYNNLLSYRKAILLIAGFVLLGFILSLYGCRDKEIMRTIKPQGGSYLSELKEVLKNKNYIAFLFAFCFANIAYLTLLAMVPYFNKWILNQPAKFESYIYGAGVATSAIFFIVWARVSFKKGPKFVFLTSATLFSLILIPLFFFSSDISTIVLMGIIGAPLAGMMLIPEVLIGEIIDDDYQKFGKNREGLFFGFYGFAVRIAMIVEASVISLILGLTGYNGNANKQTETAIIGIKLLIVVVPIICFVIGITLMASFYDLSKKRIARERAKQSDMDLEIE
ncbi:MAG: MFS transporter [Candidatus Heimdallarchaeaceae archaeon]